MKHLALFFICILSVEIFVRFRFPSRLESILIMTQKFTRIFPNDKISDHWKEKFIKAYSLRLMIFSVQTLLILLCIISLFFISDTFLSGFLAFTLSLIGIIESMLFAFGYVYLRKLVIK